MSHPGLNDKLEVVFPTFDFNIDTGAENPIKYQVKHLTQKMGNLSISQSTTNPSMFNNTKPTGQLSVQSSQIRQPKKVYPKRKLNWESSTQTEINLDGQVFKINDIVLLEKTGEYAKILEFVKGESGPNGEMKVCVFDKCGNVAYECIFDIIEKDSIGTKGYTKISEPTNKNSLVNCKLVNVAQLKYFMHGVHYKTTVYDESSDDSTQDIIITPGSNNEFKRMRRIPVGDVVYEYRKYYITNNNVSQFVTVNL